MIDGMARHRRSTSIKLEDTKDYLVVESWMAQTFHHSIHLST